jgi:hypothetical protein
MAVLHNLDSLRIVLARGRFESAQGFDLSADRRVATLSPTPAADPDAPVIVVRLRWRE